MPNINAPQVHVNVSIDKLNKNSCLSGDLQSVIEKENRPESKQFTTPERRRERRGVATSQDNMRVGARKIYSSQMNVKQSPRFEIAPSERSHQFSSRNQGFLRSSMPTFKNQVDDSWVRMNIDEHEDITQIDIQKYVIEKRKESMRQ